MSRPKLDNPAVHRTLRIPNELDQYIQAKASKDALLSGKRPGYTQTLVSMLIKTMTEPQTNEIDTEV